MPAHRNLYLTLTKNEKGSPASLNLNLFATSYGTVILDRTFQLVRPAGMHTAADNSDFQHSWSVIRSLLSEYLVIGFDLNRVLAFAAGWLSSSHLRIILPCIHTLDLQGKAKTTLSLGSYSYGSICAAIRLMSATFEPEPHELCQMFHALDKISPVSDIDILERRLDSKEISLICVFPSLDTFCDIPTARALVHKGAHCVLAGRFLYGSKEACRKRLREKGIYVTNEIRPNTDFVIVGDLGDYDWKPDYFGPVLTQALAIRKHTGRPCIIKEEVIRHLLK